MTEHILMLAMDQRPWLTKALYGHVGEPTAAERAAMCNGKHMVLDGLLAAIDRPGSSIPRDDVAVLVDEQLGAGVAERARAHGVTLSMPIERGGLEIFETDPDDLAAFVRHHAPELTKVLVRYNTEGDTDANRVQRKRLAEASTTARTAGSHFLFELLVPATEAQLASVDGDESRYHHELRPELIIAAMREIQSVVEVDVWKLEHLAEPRFYAEAARLAHAQGGSRCILLGANAEAETVEAWLRDAASSGFVGFAVGRSIWWEAYRRYLAGEMTHEGAVDIVSERYTRFAQSFLAAEPTGRRTTRVSQWP